MANKKYEELYSQLYDRATEIHEGNKKRLKRGVASYLILPIVLIIVRYITDSDKTFFLIIWVFGMFIISGILMGVEYLDDKILKTLNECTDREAEFDDLIELPTTELSERVRTRIAERKAEREQRQEELLDAEAQNIESELAEADAKLAEADAEVAEADAKVANSEGGEI